MPVADAIALIYVYPFLVTAMAPYALGERVPLAAWIGVIGGFLGVVIVMRPDFGGVSIHALSAVLCGVALAFSLLINRKLAGASPPLVTATTSALIGTIVFAIPLIAGGWQPLGREAMLLIALLGIISAVNQWMILEAFSYAHASTLAPIGYVEIVAGVAVGYLWFADVPDGLVIVGIGVIIASGLIVARARG
jgi:drug/metabolite transporter (DMT)-like permease